MFAFILLGSALAADLRLSEHAEGAVFAWVDGEPVGKVKKKDKPTVVSVKPGTHEVWFASEKSGTLTLCHGTLFVLVAGNDVHLTESEGGYRCEGIEPGFTSGKSAFRGAFVEMTRETETEAWVVVDGGRVMTLPTKPVLLNLKPGAYTLSVYNDIGKYDLFAEGEVKLTPGQQTSVACKTTGCSGYAGPATAIAGLEENKPAVTDGD